MKKINKNYSWGYSYAYGCPAKSELNWVKTKINTVCKRAKAEFTYSPFVGHYGFIIYAETLRDMRDALSIMKTTKDIESIKYEMRTVRTLTY